MLGLNPCSFAVYLVYDVAYPVTARGVRVILNTYNLVVILSR